jgi:hypothetical protein
MALGSSIAGSVVDGLSKYFPILVRLEIDPEKLGE